MQRSAFNCIRAEDEDEEMSQDEWDDEVNDDDDDPEPEDSFFHDPYEQFQAATAGRRHQGRGQAGQRDEGNVVDDLAHSDGDGEAFVPSPKKKRGRRGQSGSTTRQDSKPQVWATH